MNQASTSLGSIDQILDRLVASLAVEHAVEQLDVALLVAEEMIKLEPAEIAVLEGRQFLQEDDRVGVAVAVEEGEAALRLGAQRRLDQRYHRRDPRPAGEADIATLRRGIELHRERPCGSITSSVSPAFSLSPTQLEKTPPAIRLTVTIKSSSAGAVHSE